MRVASVRAVSETPERDAWARLRAWAEPRGLLNNPKVHPVFGFNNPPPSDQQKEYGYEFWIKVDAPTASDREVEVKDFAGGLFLVTTCRLANDPAGSIGEIWRALWEMTQTGPYRWRRAHELERPHDPQASESEMVLDLYLPVERSATAAGKAS